MNAETLKHMPPGAQLMVRLAITSEIAKARTFHTALLALLVYDAACTLPRERRTMWKRPTAMSLCYLVTRYLPIIYATGITVLERIGVNPAVCQRIVRLTNAPPIVSFLAASILLIQRVHSIYDRNLMVTVPLYGLLAVSCGVQLRVIFMTQANELPALLGISACIPAPGNSPWYLAYHAAQTIVDLAVVNVTLVKIFKLHRQFNSVLVKKIMYDTLFWFLLIFGAALCNALYFRLSDSTKNKAMLGPLTFSIESIAASRMFLGLRAAAENNTISSRSMPSNRATGGGSLTTPKTPTTPLTPFTPWSAAPLPVTPTSGGTSLLPSSPMGRDFHRVELDYRGIAL